MNLSYHGGGELRETDYSSEHPGTGPANTEQEFGDLPAVEWTVKLAFQSWTMMLCEHLYSELGNVGSMTKDR